ncbi:MAG: phage portal protein [Candidatus Nucleicultricaceae bacterium]
MPQKILQKSSRFGAMNARQHAGRAVWTPRRYDTLMEEGYRKNAIAYRAVSIIARGAASVPWRVFKHGQELSDHPLISLIHKPNPLQAGASFFESVLSYLLLAGNSYVELLLGDNGPLELYTLRPDRVRVIPGPNGCPLRYEYRVNGEAREVGMDPVTGTSPILHLKLFNPLNDWYGLSPLESAIMAIDQHNEVASHNLALLQNGGSPTGALVIGKNTPDERLDEENLTHLRESLDQLYRGTKNAGRMLILEGDFEWQEMGLSPKDLNFVEGKNMSAREIAQAFGVPPMLVGISGDATYSNYREARLHLWEDTILPLLDYLTDELNRWLTPLYGAGLRLAYDIEGVPALAERRNETWQKLEQVTFLTQNEKREAIGYGALDAPIQNPPSDS